MFWLTTFVILQEASVKHKVLADGIEALLGAYLQAGDLAGAWALLAALNILPIPEQANYPVAPDEGAATTSGPSSIKTREVDKHPPAGDQGGLGRAGYDPPAVVALNCSLAP